MFRNLIISFRVNVDPKSDRFGGLLRVYFDGSVTLFFTFGVILDNEKLFPNRFKQLT
jgi:hypothetical protein